MQQIENYTKEKRTIDLVWANIFGFLILIPIVGMYGVPYFMIWGNPFEGMPIIDAIRYARDLFIENSLWAVLYFFVGIVLHEFIHGLTWSLFTTHGFKSITFGVMWKMLTPYCHCKEPLKIKHYILGALMPAIVLGLAPALIGIVIGDLNWLIFGAFFTMAAAGDFLIVNLLKNERMHDLVQDHPSEAGCFVYRKPGHIE